MRAKKRHNRHQLLYAVLEGDAAAVKAMLAAGTPVESRDSEHGETALMLAVKFNRDIITALLLGAGADVNARDAAGQTPLMYAGAETVPLLLAAGAQVNTQDGAGETALIKAAGSANTAKVMALLANGADWHTLDRDGRGAWDYAHDLGIKALTDIL